LNLRNKRFQEILKLFKNTRIFQNTMMRLNRARLYSSKLRMLLKKQKLWEDVKEFSNKNLLTTVHSINYKKNLPLICNSGKRLVITTIIVAYGWMEQSVTKSWTIFHKIFSHTALL
jgi:hypothetical protein